MTGADADEDVGAAADAGDGGFFVIHAAAAKRMPRLGYTPLQTPALSGDGESLENAASLTILIDDL
jgi:hypothetical protein